MHVYPLINYVDAVTTRLQAALAMQSGSSGIVISANNGHDSEAMGVSAEIKLTHPGLKVGLNIVQTLPMQTLMFAAQAHLDMVWFDDIGFCPSGLSFEGLQLAKCACSNDGIKIFASLASFYAWNIKDPLAGEAAKFSTVKNRNTSRDYSIVPGSVRAPDIARQLMGLGFVPLMVWAESNLDDSNTSNISNSQHSFERASEMFGLTHGHFAIASGTGPITVNGQVPYITHIIEIDESHPTESLSRLNHLKSLVAHVDGFDPMLLA